MPSGLVLLPNVPGESYSITFTNFMLWVIIFVALENNGCLDRSGA